MVLLHLTLFVDRYSYLIRHFIPIACSKAIQEATGKPEAYIGMFMLSSIFYLLMLINIIELQHD